MKNIPQLPTPNACSAEAQYIIQNCTDIVRWLNEHKASQHPGEPTTKRLIIICDHGPEWLPLLAFAGQDPPSHEYVSELLAKAWGVMTEQRTIQ